MAAHPPPITAIRAGTRSDMMRTRRFLYQMSTTKEIPRSRDVRTRHRGEAEDKVGTVHACGVLNPHFDVARQSALRDGGGRHSGERVAFRSLQSAAYDSA